MRSPARSTSPDEFCLTYGRKFVCTIDRTFRQSSGTVFDEHGEICWQYNASRNPRGRSWQNPLNKPDFVFTNTDGHRTLTIRRVSFIPSVFQILDGGDSIGQIALSNILGTQYEIRLDECAAITFRLPLFTLRFWGDSEAGQIVWVQVGPSKMQWNVLLKPGTNDRELVASLAFIHNQWWNFS